MSIRKNIKYVLSVVLIVAVFALSGANWSSAVAGEAAVGIARLNCVDTYLDGPNFLYNHKPTSIGVTASDDNCLPEVSSASDDNCLPEVSFDHGPSFLFNSKSISTGSLEFQDECLQAQAYFGAPTFIVNPEPAASPEVAGIEGKCSPG